MAAKKAAKPAEKEVAEAPAKSSKVEPASSEDVQDVYRVDLGESLPPQKKPGVE